ncbi:MAG: hypothetical protein R3E01_11090 [Pirellulaceae bacterium]|nr:hypothetical protein [Planctomycetales bacterium]
MTIYARHFLMAVVVAFGLAVHSSMAQLYTENFDDINAALRWQANAMPQGLTNPDGSAVPFTDFHADFAFDYSSVGIPAAPNTTDGSTVGMKLQANLIEGVFGGGSASPLDQNFEGSYKLTFDYWGNYTGDPTTGLETGGIGQSNLSTFGIMTNGMTATYAGAGDGLWFAGTVDGGSSSDYRAYSVERVVSYQYPPADGIIEDTHATYYAESRNNTADLYANNFGGAMAPSEQLALFPQQLGATPAGSLGMEWHQVEIRKDGTTVDWIVDGIKLITVETAEFTSPPGGGNILFGHADINSSISEDAGIDLLFTLIDNIKVEVLEDEPGLAGDYNMNGTVDAADYTVWKDSFGSTSDLAADGNGNGEIDAADYTIWKDNFGNTGAVASVASVPEPSCLAMLGFGAIVLLRRRITLVP